MAKVETFSCDQCEKIRANDSNHWFELLLDREAKTITIRPFHRMFGTHIEHICGQECLHKALDRYVVAI